MNLYNILMQDDIESSIINNLEELLTIIPELKYTINFEHKHPHHHLDVWKHTLLALNLSEKDFDIRLSLLLHDIGKPWSYEEGEIRHFPNHPLVSSNISRNILTRLNYDDNYIDYICYLIRHHDSPITKEQIINNYDLVLKLYKIQTCDALAHHPDHLKKRKQYLIKTLIKINEVKS